MKLTRQFLITALKYTKKGIYRDRFITYGRGFASVERRFKLRHSSYQKVFVDEIFWIYGTLVFKNKKGVEAIKYENY